MAGSSTGNDPAFFLDLSSPEAWLTAERILALMPVPCEWVPVHLPFEGAFRCAEEEQIFKAEFERRAAAQGVQAVRWPDPFPADTEWALRVATYAKQIGRAVAFSLAAFRQAFAGGRDLSDPDTVLIAAAACEMHPVAVAKGADLKSIGERLDRATAEAAAAGVLDVPAVVFPDGRVLHEL